MARELALTILALGYLLALENARSVADAQSLPQYEFVGLRGKVVGDEDGRPLAGVFVVALWASHAPPPYVFKTVRAIETETRADGTFVLAPWHATISNPLTDESPVLVFFAPARVPYSSTQAKLPAAKPGEYRLLLFDGLPENRAAQLRKLAWGLGFHWVHLHGQPSPRVLSALDSDWHQLAPEDQGSGSPSLMFEATVQSTRYGYEQELLKQR